MNEATGTGKSFSPQWDTVLVLMTKSQMCLISEETKNLGYNNETQWDLSYVSFTLPDVPSKIPSKKGIHQSSSGKSLVL